MINDEAKTGTGYSESPEWDPIRNLSFGGEGFTLAELHKRIENGSVGWEAEDVPEKTSR